MLIFNFRFQGVEGRLSLKPEEDDSADIDEQMLLDAYQRLRFRHHSADPSEGYETMTVSTRPPCDVSTSRL